jgi:hypothetical protein
MLFGGGVPGAICLALMMMVSAAGAADLRLRPACDRPGSDGLLTVEDRSVVFFASAYDLRRAIRRPDGVVWASGLRSDEGEGGRTPDDLTLKLLSPDRLHVVTNSPGGHTYHRCKDKPH